MTRDVLITISGIQLAEGDSNEVEMITAGDYFQKNGSHYISVSYTHLTLPTKA